ncbi:hypothetical protein M422DRAFT_39406, partial [Sphaerobolus stellatus SS14]
LALAAHSLAPVLTAVPGPAPHNPPPTDMLRRAHHPHRHKLMPRMPRRCWWRSPM